MTFRQSVARISAIPCGSILPPPTKIACNEPTWYPGFAFLALTSSAAWLAEATTTSTPCNPISDNADELSDAKKADFPALRTSHRRLNPNVVERPGITRIFWPVPDAHVCGYFSNWSSAFRGCATFLGRPVVPEVK